jgi:hypothetical protein
MMGDEEKETEPELPGEDDKESRSPALRAFERRSFIGDTYFLFQSWPAWFVSPVEKLIAPVSRIYIGDTEGNIIFQRDVVMTGLLDLIDELSGTIETDIAIASEMPKGFYLSIPGTTQDFVKRLKAIEERLATIVKKIEETKIVKGSESSETEKSGEPAGPVADS